LCGFAPPHFAVAGLCFAKPFYATAKRQLPRTLCAIHPKRIVKIIFIWYNKIPIGENYGKPTD